MPVIVITRLRPFFYRRVALWTFSVEDVLLAAAVYRAEHARQVAARHPLVAPRGPVELVDGPMNGGASCELPGAPEAPWRST